MLDISKIGKGSISENPFWHYVEDDFLPEQLATSLFKEFPSYQNNALQNYDNPLETKRIQSRWYEFKEITYSFITYLYSNEFINFISKVSGINDLKPDIGLHGAGQFLHSKGGRLNPHLDYTIHPKLGLERRLSLLIYLTPDWHEEWKGEFVLYDKKEELKEVKKITPRFNRMILFKTTSAWHGVPEAIRCPPNVNRCAIGIFYLTLAREGQPLNSKALYSAYNDQIGDKDIETLIQKRFSEDTARSVYF